jgi:hypothetical protein
VLMLRLRQSEVALADGRLDEVYQMVATSPINSHRRGQKLVTRLIDALVKRGGEHLASKHFSEALADCEKAAKLAGNQPRIVALRAAAVAGWTAAERERRQPARVDGVDSPVRPAVVMSNQESLASRFVLHVDAVGSFLVLRQPMVRIGPISGSMPADVAVMCEPGAAPLTIERVEDDYFLRTGNLGKGKLLASDDRLDLSPRCRLKFLVPNKVSTTAVLDLTGARLPRMEIRRIILMDQDLIIGPNSTSHVQAGAMSESMVLHVRQDRLYCQTHLPVMVKDEVADLSKPLPMGESVKTDGLCFAVTR